jgi:hypothetical protein
MPRPFRDPLRQQNSTAGTSAKAGGPISGSKLEIECLVQDRLVSGAKARDLVLYQQLLTLQLSDLEVIGRRMDHRIRDFILKRPMLAFKFRKMGLHGHMERLLGQFAEHP